MKYFIFTLFVFSAFSLQAKKQCDCHKYMTGKFYSLHEEKNKFDTLYITRTKTEQTEKIGDYKKTFRVIWLSSCKFIIRDYGHTSNAKKFLPTDVMSVIIETTDEYYFTKAWLKGGKKGIYKIFRYPY